MESQGEEVDSELKNEITETSDNISDGDTDEMGVYENGYGSEPHEFATVSIVNSSQVQIGNNIYYHGPVTLNQIEAPSKQDSTVPYIPEENPRSKTCIRSKHKKWYILMGTFIAISMIFFLIYLLIVRFTHSKTDLNSNSIPMREYSIPFNDTADLNTNRTHNRTRIYERSVWRPRQQSEEIERLNTPVPVVMIIHSATSTCSTFNECTEMIRGFQEFHMDNLHLEDIGYNFLVGGEGRIYEGRGWDKMGAHTYHWNRNSTGICLIGNFMHVEPTLEQISATRKLIQLGVHLGKISRDYKLVAHRQAIKTESPGLRLFALMADWPHFSSS